MNLLCPLCVSGQTRYLFIKQRNPHYSCSGCGFIFFRPDKNANFENDIGDFEPAYLNYLGDQAHDKKNHEALIRKLSRYKLLAGCSLLDIGCGSGKLVKYLRQKGINAVGIEPSKAIYHAFLEGQPDFFQGDITDFTAKDPGVTFDVIIVADVLEHVEHPADFMQTVSNLLNPDGILFVSTPDTNSLFARLAGKRWHYYNKYHLSLFSTQNLAKLATAHGLSKLESGHLARYQSLYYMMKYCWNFVLRTDRGVPGLLKRINLPVNLFDNQYAIFRR